ncbi:AAA family ATPase [Ralstonia solanacearum]|uniref:Atpase protein n=1 Tax=Ralstonia solanacearum (strain Po82) TaxID=1031711 RepID=F6G1Q2_RALS8|nr:MoxR family ATPase [Ralstonia solanacearum]AEG69185.1 atpase protein [Ralstonia solanacearum Po82]AMP70496.1 ATPase [Ralstonia solanacearum]AMP72768.1 ATPase [Ralstonia solanacearum]AYB60721.1 MoxR family ATPase [Ralstonia solanacearum]EUJ14804.1 ATPase [Ralstonia solanacearum P673]
MPVDSIDDCIARLQAQGYFASRELATALFLALRMQRPLFLEGEPGVGKTELAKAAAGLLGTSLLRLQCYEGLDTASALYEWDYPRQIMALRLAEAAGERPRADTLYRDEFLLKRPLLQALLPDPANLAAHPTDTTDTDRPRVLLIDEIDRADEPFEAFLLELLSDFQVSIPEFGTVRARVIPLVVMTSNRTREVHDALKRRCLYQWIGYPDKARELQIVAQRAPEAAARLQQRAVAFVHRLRGIDLFKAPGIAETIDWCRALAALNVTELDPQSVQDTLGVLLKYQDDLARVDAPVIEQLLAAPALPE